MPGSSRRSFLHTLGIGALASALPMVSRSRAVASPPEIPKRIVFFYGAGSMYNTWIPTGVGGAPPTESAWELGPLHAPLAPHKDDLIVINGLGMVSEELDVGPPGSAHTQGSKHALAAATTSQPHLPGGISIDQRIAQGLKDRGVVTQFPSLEFQCAGWSNDDLIFSKAVASAPNTPLPSMWDPRTGYDRIFGPFGADAMRSRKLAALGLAEAEGSRLRTRLGKDDRAKLDAHLSLVRDLESRLGAGVRPCERPSKAAIEAQFTSSCDLACERIDDPTIFARNFELTIKNNTALAVAALACDLTRVCFLEAQTAPNGLVGYRDGDLGAMDFHDLTHKYFDPSSTQSRDPLARALLEKACTIEAQKLADLIAMMKAIPESDGQTLFDHSVILWCSQIGYGSHDLGSLPWVIAGDAAGYFRTGRYLALPPNPKSRRGQPHNDLFVSLANAMDVPLTTFGNPACCNGPLAGLT